MSDYVINQKIQKSRIKLSKKSDGLSFFGACSYKFDWAIHEMPNMNAEGYVLFDKETHNVEDGTIHINEELVKKNDYSYIHLAFIVCHELLHILGKHGIRRGMRDMAKWAVACDHVVERDLKTLAAAIYPYGSYHYFEELHKHEPKCTVERVYKWIEKQIKLGNMNITPSEDGEGFNVDGQHGTFYVNAQLGGVDPKKGVKEKDLDTIQTNDKIIADARALHQNFKTKGEGSSDLTSYLDQILKVKIPWESLLEKAIKTNVILKPDERSWKNPNKFYRPLGITLPGSTMSETSDGTGIILYGTDSSGSMSDEDLKKCSSVVEQSFDYFKQVWLYVHDTDVKQRKIFEKDDKFQFMHFLKNEGYKGRGGTQHGPVFSAVQKELWEENGYKNDLSMAIFLTDGYSDIEHQIKNKQNEWLTVIPIVFVITGSYKLEISDMDNITVIYMDERN